METHNHSETHRLSPVGRQGRKWFWEPLPLLYRPENKGTCQVKIRTSWNVVSSFSIQIPLHHSIFDSGLSWAVWKTARHRADFSGRQSWRRQGRNLRLDFEGLALNLDVLIVSGQGQGPRLFPSKSQSKFGIIVSVLLGSFNDSMRNPSTCLETLNHKVDMQLI